MEVFRPGNVSGVSHSGTFNGNPVTMEAGRETLRYLTDEAYARLDALGTRLARGLEIAIDQTGVRASVMHVGSLVNVLFTDLPITNAETARPLDPRAAQAFHLGLMNRGIFIAPRGLFALSLASTEDQVDLAVDAAREVFRLLAAADLRRSDGGAGTEQETT
jgi:glutamate-1-semialdehyde 2,1-aminomutase